MPHKDWNWFIISLLLCFDLAYAFDLVPLDAQSLLAIDRKLYDYDIENGVKTMRLTDLADTDDFTVLRHPDLPEYGVRVKKTRFCDPTVK